MLSQAALGRNRSRGFPYGTVPVCAGRVGGYTGKAALTTTALDLLSVPGGLLADGERELPVDPTARGLPGDISTTELG
jgi:hypothetical protein